MTASWDTLIVSANDKHNSRVRVLLYPTYWNNSVWDTKRRWTSQTFLSKARTECCNSPQREADTRVPCGLLLYTSTCIQIRSSVFPFFGLLLVKSFGFRIVHSSRSTWTARSIRNPHHHQRCNSTYLCPTPTPRRATRRARTARVTPFVRRQTDLTGPVHRTRTCQICRYFLPCTEYYTSTKFCVYFALGSTANETIS